MTKRKSKFTAAESADHDAIASLPATNVHDETLACIEAGNFRHLEGIVCALIRQRGSRVVGPVDPMIEAMKLIIGGQWRDIEDIRAVNRDLQRELAGKANPES